MSLTPMKAYEQVDGNGLVTNGNGNIRLTRIKNCWIQVANVNRANPSENSLLPGGSDKYYFTALPELSWSKNANYNAQPIIGRPVPVITYAHSGPKSVTVTIHMHNPTRNDMDYNLSAVNYLAGALHPRLDATYAPPPICTFHCGPGAAKSGGSLRSPMQHFNFIMTSMKQNMGSDTVWDTDYMMPKSWDIDISGDIVYTYIELPGAAMVQKGDW